MGLATILALAILTLHGFALPVEDTPAVNAVAESRNPGAMPETKKPQNPSVAFVVQSKPRNQVTEKKDIALKANTNDAPLPASLVNSQKATPQITKNEKSEELKSTPKLTDAISKAQTNAESTLEKFNSQLLMVSVSMGSGRSYCDLTEGNQRDYAARHGYNYVRYHEEDKSKLGITGDPKWAKTRGLQRLIDGSHKWVVWIDCDMVVTNKDQTFEKIIATHGRSATDLIIARDSYYKKSSQAIINSGIMIIRDDPWSKGFFEAVSAKGKVKGTGLEDQPRIILELIERGELSRSPAFESESHEHTVVVPQRVMNSFVREGFDDSESAKWRPGDFIAHVTGMATQNRIKRIKRLLEHPDEKISHVLLQDALHINDMSLIQSATSLEATIQMVLSSPEALDKIESNWKIMLTKALVDEDWNLVQILQE